jgi:hypothetical protein
MGDVASLCGPTVNPRIGMSLGTWRREDQWHIIGLDVTPLYRRVVMFSSLPFSLLSFEHFMFN